MGGVLYSSTMRTHPYNNNTGTPHGTHQLAARVVVKASRGWYYMHGVSQGVHVDQCLLMNV